MLLAGNPNSRITVIVDNMLYASDSNDGDLLHWDDTNEILYVLRHNEDHRDHTRPYQIQMFEYELIQAMELDTNKNGIMGPALACGFKEDEVQEMIKKFSTINLNA